MGRILPSIRGRGTGVGGPSSFASTDLQRQRRAQVIAAGEAASARMAGSDPKPAIAPNQVDLSRIAGDRVIGFRELQGVRAQGSAEPELAPVARAVEHAVVREEDRRRRRRPRPMVPGGQ